MEEERHHLEDEISMHKSTVEVKVKDNKRLSEIL
jgi:hypothetical protein